MWRIDFGTLEAPVSRRPRFSLWHCVDGAARLWSPKAGVISSSCLRRKAAHAHSFDDLPGYPSRLTARSRKRDIWLAVFAPRAQLIEFVLREDEYRGRMMEEIEPEYWIAPSLIIRARFLEPVQGGA